jgi:hypothetical protein
MRLVKTPVKTVVPRCDESIQVEEQMLAMRQHEAQSERLPQAKRALEMAQHEFQTLQREVSYLENQLKEYSEQFNQGNGLFPREDLSQSADKVSSVKHCTVCYFFHYYLTLAQVATPDAKREDAEREREFQYLNGNTAMTLSQHLMSEDHLKELLD